MVLQEPGRSWWLSRLPPILVESLRLTSWISGHLASNFCTVLGCHPTIGLYRAGAKAQLGAKQTATTTGGINEETGANITGIQSQWNLTNPDPGSGPLAPLNATNSREL